MKTLTYRTSSLENKIMPPILYLFTPLAQSFAPYCLRGPRSCWSHSHWSIVVIFLIKLVPRCFLRCSILLLPNIFTEVALLDENLNLTIQLEVFLGIMIVVMMEATILLLVLSDWWRLHQWRSVEVSLNLDLHEHFELGGYSVEHNCCSTETDSSIEELLLVEKDLLLFFYFSS